MKRLLVLAEGQTEEHFVRRVLNPHLRAFDVYLAVTCIATKVVDSKRVFRGGHGRSYGSIRRDLLRLLGDTDAAIVTTLIDYYGLPPDFPGLTDRPAGDGYVRVSHVEQAFGRDIGHTRFDPHLILPEFEGLLLCCPAAIQAHFPDVDCRQALEAIRIRVTSPEEINESPETAPSKRLAKLIPGYDKRADGPLLAEHIGLAKLREQSPHFSAWIARLEQSSHAV